MPDLTPQEVKVLHYVVSKADAVRPSQCVVRSNVSTDLPRSPFVARAVLERLRAWGYVARTGRGYVAEKKGRMRVRQADAQGEWRAPVLA